MNNTTNGSNAKTIKIILCVVALMLAVITAVALIAAFVPSSVRDDTALSEVTDRTVSVPSGFITGLLRSPSGRISAGFS